jgi:FkbM family methyltransferase
MNGIDWLRGSINIKVNILSCLNIWRLNRDFVIEIPGRVTAKNEVLAFRSKNYVTKFRYETFFFKEPETLTWINEMEPGAVFWDVGANIGLYTLYFMKVNPQGKVTAFEPHPANLYSLMENASKNGLCDGRLTIIPNPIYNENKMVNFTFNSIAIGDSNHTILENQSSESIRLPSVTLKSLRADGLPAPNYLKIDVDGNELQILEAATEILTDKTLKGALVEVDIADVKQANAINGILIAAGFKEKSRHDGMSKFDKSSEKKLFNIIYSR